MLDMKIRATALGATLAALDDGFAQGRAAGDPLQAELLAIAREQTTALIDREADDAGCRHLPSRPRASVGSGVVIPFRRQAKISASSASS